MDKVVASSLDWDVMGGVARRAWARNENAMETTHLWNEKMGEQGHITEPEIADDELVVRTVDAFKAKE
jgi:urocanate hydratase